MDGTAGITDPDDRIARRRYVVEGRVQGVGYRAWTQLRATALGLVGFVRNRPDGAVEIVAEGRCGVLARFEEECRRGPLLARVSAVRATEEMPAGGFGFEVRR
jgi:acylphosphatase